MSNFFNKNLIKIFKIRKPHGLKGYLKIDLYIEDEDLLELVKSEINIICDNGNSYKIQDTIKIVKELGIKLQDIDRIEDVQNLVNNDFFIQRDDLKIELIPQDLIDVNVFCNKDNTKELYGKIVGYNFFKNMKSMMLKIEENKDKSIILIDMDSFSDYNKQKNEIILNINL